MRGLKETRVLITGGGGFIGSHLAKRLVKEGSKVFLLLNIRETRKNIEDIKDSISIYEADISDLKNLKLIIKKIEPQKIFHLAAFTDVDRSFPNAEKAIKVNITGTINLLCSLSDTDYDSFVHTGTSEEYGNIQTPFKESQKIKPASPYSASKAASEILCETYKEMYNLPIVFIRPSLTYGPFQDTNRLIPQAIISALQKKDFEMSKGEQAREVNYVDDIVDGFVKASINKRAIGEIINLGFGEEYRIIDIVDLIVKLVGNPIKVKAGAIPYRKNEVWHMFCDNSKAKELLNWQPKIDLEQGLKITINWYKRMLEKNQLNMWIK